MTTSQDILAAMAAVPGLNGRSWRRLCRLGRRAG